MSTPGFDLKAELELRRGIVEYGRMMDAKGWIAANDGNLSARLDSSRVLSTPAGVSKGRMLPEDLVVVDMAGRKLAGARECSSEIGMHLAVYRMRPDVHAVVHAHPPVATGHAAAGRALNLAVLPEMIVMLGCVPLADYGLPGTPELLRPMLPLIPDHDAILMANHGAVAFGRDLQEAFFRMETVEHGARISLVAELLGGPKILPRAEVAKLIESRARYGVPTRASAQANCPVAAGESLIEAKSPDRFWVSREELIAIVDEALKRLSIRETPAAITE
ncbi:MAG: class II aldolase/adducin family protein [Bryobacteraceae bacterium]